MKIFFLLFCFAVMVLLPGILHSQSSWFWQQPYPAGNELWGVKMVNSDLVYTCGRAGTVMKSTNAGQNWSLLNTGTFTFLYSIDFMDANTGIAAGDSGIVIRTTNGGASWTKYSLAATRIRTVNFAPNSSTVYLTAENGYCGKSTNAGASWSQVNIGTSYPLISVSFRDPMNGYIGGANVYKKTSNGGINWTEYYVPGFFQYVCSISYPDSNNIILLLEGDTIIKSTDAGNSWTKISSHVRAQTECCDFGRQISFCNRDTGLLISDFGLIGKTTDGGANWSYDHTYYRYDSRINLLWGIDNYGEDSYTIVGSGGKILRTDDQGDNFRIQNGFIKSLYGNYFVNETTGFNVGDSGKVFKTTDGGNSWHLQNSPTTRRLNAVHFPSVNVGYIAGDSGTIMRSSDGGANWVMQNSGISPGFLSTINDIHFYNESLGIAGVDSAKVLKTTNGGNNWVRIILPMLGTVYSVYTLTDSIYMASTSTRIFRSSNAGLNWYQAGVGSTGEGFNLEFSNLNTGYCVASTTGSYRTTNGGQNWIQFLLPGTTYAGLTKVQAINDSIIFACGDYGTVIKSTNGGINWSLLPRITENLLTSIHFINNNTGFVVGEFGTMLKTTNGGITFISQNSSEITDNYYLSQNYPNPFNPYTRIDYEIKKDGNVKLILYDVSGKQVEKLVDEFHKNGKYSFIFDGSNLSSGIYYYSLLYNQNNIITKKCVLIK